jgi:hypothetical protein
MELALGLGARERAELASRLIASLDESEDEDAESWWDAEIQRRLALVDSGDAIFHDADEVIQKLRDRLPNT